MLFFIQLQKNSNNLPANFVVNLFLTFEYVWYQIETFKISFAILTHPKSIHSIYTCDPNPKKCTSWSDALLPPLNFFCPLAPSFSHSDIANFERTLLISAEFNRPLFRPSAFPLLVDFLFFFFSTPVLFTFILLQLFVYIKAIIE